MASRAEKSLDLVAEACPNEKQQCIKRVELTSREKEEKKNADRSESKTEERKYIDKGWRD